MCVSGASSSTTTSYSDLPLVVRPPAASSPGFHATLMARFRDLSTTDSAYAPFFAMRDSGPIILRKTEGAGKSGHRRIFSDPSSLPLASLAESNSLLLPSVGLSFEVGEYPESKWLYWRNIALKSFAIGIQLHQRGCAYHLDSVGSRYEIQRGLTVTLKASHSINAYLCHRIYEIEEKDKEARIFDHFSLDWEDMKLPNETSFLELVRLLQTTGLTEKKTHIHCLSGRGRSGTLVFTLALALTGSDKPEGLLENIRAQRAGLVETDEQKEFALTCALKLTR